MKIWNIRDTFGQPAKVRLRQDGRLEIKKCGARVWRLIKIIDISIFTDKDVKQAIKQTQGIAQVKRG